MAVAVISLRSSSPPAPEGWDKDITHSNRRGEHPPRGTELCTPVRDEDVGEDHHTLYSNPPGPGARDEGQETQQADSAAKGHLDD